MNLSFMAATLYLAASNFFVAQSTGVLPNILGSFSKEQIETMLDGKGAAGDTGALNELNTMVGDYGKGFVSIGQSAVIYIAIIALIIAIGACALHARNSAELSNDKKALPVVIICLVAVFAISGIVLFTNNVGSQMFSSQGDAQAQTTTTDQKK